MKPIKVEAGQLAPDVDQLLEKANKLMEKAEQKETDKFGSEHADLFVNVTGKDKPVKTGYYDTNQRRIEVKDVAKTKPKMENVNLTPIGYPYPLEARENKKGDPSDKNPPSAYNLTDYL
tara:strand:- start:5314 stop:5670 length:357 start_codon:yes stop_codon:yes gene_type:complete